MIKKLSVIAAVPFGKVLKVVTEGSFFIPDLQKILEILGEGDSGRIVTVQPEGNHITISLSADLGSLALEKIQKALKALKLRGTKLVSVDIIGGK